MKSLISIDDISKEGISWIISRAIEFSNKGVQILSLSGKIIGTLFNYSSTRTRSSFYVGAIKLGGNIINYGKNELQLFTGESIIDTFKVLSGYLDILVVRDNIENNSLKKLADISKLPVINAMSFEEHPTQGLSDFSFIQCHFGKLAGLKCLYLGEVNSTVLALVKLTAKIKDFQLTIVAPSGYRLIDVLRKNNQDNINLNDSIRNVDSIDNLNDVYDIVYTTKWSTTGTSKEDVFWKEKFNPLKITKNILDRFLKDKNSIFMHDLPAIRDEDTDSSVLDSSRSYVFKQAHHKLYTAMAVYEYCLEKS